MITKAFIETLGWKADFPWNDKTMLSYKDINYSIFEYNGDWGIMDPYAKSFELIYCDMTSEHIKNFTDLIQNLEQLLDNPLTTTGFYNFIEASTKMKTFVKEMRDRS